MSVFVLFCYSFAIILWEILFRKNPFGDERHMSKIKNAIINEKKRPGITMQIEKEYEEIMTKNWDERQDERLEFGEILELLKNVAKNKNLN